MDVFRVFLEAGVQFELTQFVLRVALPHVLLCTLLFDQYLSGFGRTLQHEARHQYSHRKTSTASHIAESKKHKHTVPTDFKDVIVEDLSIITLVMT